MILNRILNKHTLSLIMALSIGFSIVPTFGMEAPIKETGSAQTNLTRPRLFTTREKLDLIQFTEELFDLSREKKSLEVLSQSFPDRSIGISLTQEEQENYYYYRFAALASACKDLGDRETDKPSGPENASQYYSQAIQYVRSYLDLFETCIFENTALNRDMLSHRSYIYQIGGHACFELGNSYVLKKSKADLVKIYKEAMNYIENVMQYANNTNTPPKYLRSIKYILFNIYRSLMDHCLPIEEVVFFKKAKQINLEFKNEKDSEAQYFFKETKQSLDLWNMLQEKNILSQLNNRGKRSNGSKKITEIREKKIEAMNLEMLREYHTLERDVTDIRLSIL